ncbi:MAG TPA: hypothetical protein VM165_06460 [Planctomycetaceae bacterium]|nr:hypothetical protein [Planctomycetaceae bacterium]
MPNVPFNDVARVQDLCSKYQVAYQQYKSIASPRIRDRLVEELSNINAELFVLGHLPTDMVVRAPTHWAANGQCTPAGR